MRGQLRKVAGTHSLKPPWSEWWRHWPDCRDEVVDYDHLVTRSSINSPTCEPRKPRAGDNNPHAVVHIDLSVRSAYSVEKPWLIVTLHRWGAFCRIDPWQKQRYLARRGRPTLAI